MKTRIGFVSNSSSSSFVAFLADDEFKTLRASLDEDETRALDIMSSKCGKTHWKVLEHTSDDYGTAYEMAEDDGIEDIRWQDLNQYAKPIGSVLGKIKTITSLHHREEY